MNHDKVEQWGWGGGLRESLQGWCMSHSEVPKGTNVQLSTTKKKSGQVSLSSLPSVRGLMH